jgi:hypothetical protein
VFSLIDIQFKESLVFFLFVTSESNIVKRLVWYELAFETRKKYQFVIEFYETFCFLINLTAWSAFNESLKKWVECRIYESSLLKQEKIKLDTIVSYLIELKSRHIDYELSLQAFDNLRLDLMLKEEKKIRTD